MTLSVPEVLVPAAIGVAVTADTLSVELSDGRSVSIPVSWFPHLVHASEAERRRWRFIGQGQGIHWDDLDEDIGVESLIAGRRSGESQKSLAAWLKARGVS